MYLGFFIRTESSDLIFACRIVRSKTAFVFFFGVLYEMWFGQLQIFKPGTDGHVCLLVAVIFTLQAFWKCSFPVK